MFKAMAEMKMISFDDFQDKYIGKIGTPKRDAFEKEVEEAVQSERKVSSHPRARIVRVKYMKLNGPVPKPKVMSWSEVFGDNVEISK